MKTFIVIFRTGDNERTMRVMNCNNVHHAKAKLSEYVMRKENLVPVIITIYEEHQNGIFDMLNKIVNGSL